MNEQEINLNNGEVIKNKLIKTKKKVEDKNMEISELKCQVLVI